MICISIGSLLLYPPRLLTTPRITYSHKMCHHKLIGQWLTATDTLQPIAIVKSGSTTSAGDGIPKTQGTLHQLQRMILPWLAVIARTQADPRSTHALHSDSYRSIPAARLPEPSGGPRKPYGSKLRSSTDLRNLGSLDNDSYGLRAAADHYEQSASRSPYDSLLPASGDPHMPYSRGPGDHDDPYNLTLASRFTHDAHGRNESIPTAFSQSLASGPSTSVANTRPPPAGCDDRWGCSTELCSRCCYKHSLRGRERYMLEHCTRPPPGGRQDQYGCTNERCYRCRVPQAMRGRDRLA